MVNCSEVGGGQRVVGVPTPSDPRYFTHVGRVVFINGRWTRPAEIASHRYE
jgi:hypothetical protein